MIPIEAVKLGLRLRHARQDLGLSLQDVGSSCEMHHSQVSRIERGRFKLIAKNVQTLCIFLGIDPTQPDAPARPAALHTRLDRLIRARPNGANVLVALFDALEQLTR